MALPQKRMSIEEVAVDEQVRRQSLMFQQDHPYVSDVNDGNLYRPPEAGGHDDGEKSDSDHEEVGASVTQLQSLDDFLTSPAKSVMEYTEVWHIRIVPDNFKHPKHSKPDGSLKPRRPMPHIKASEFFNGLVQEGDAWIYPHSINEWGGIKGFRLATVTNATSGMTGTTIHRLWSGKGPLPKPEAVTTKTRARMLAPKWSAVGWHPNSPGFVFWYSAMYNNNTPRMLCGTGILDQFKADDAVTRDAQLTNMHCYAHHYPVAGKRTMKDTQNIHTLILAEWSHGLFTTVIELAWVNAIGGFGGKSNWVEDKLEKTTKLYEAMPPEMNLPWDNTRSELRVYDHAARSRKEFDEYLKKYSNKAEPAIEFSQQRFEGPTCFNSGRPKVRSLTGQELTHYLLNYIQRTPAYNEISLNCQTFTADLFAFLTGQRNPSPYGTVTKAAYQQHLFSFLYMP